MTSIYNQIRSNFLKYFESNGHLIYPSAPLVVKDDPTLLFVNSGMVQFKKYFLGSEKIKDKRVATSQKCLRISGKHNDLENVGYTNRHHTFFEMLGNFSFGDYFKEDAIYYAYNFLVNELKLNPNKLYYTVHPDDEESFNLWQKIASINSNRIIKLKENFWTMGSTGPCGPCSEVFYDYGEGIYGDLPGTKDEDGPRYTEIWNLVFMQNEMLSDGTLVNLDKKCIDTGMGLERIVSVMEGTTDNYQTSLFVNLKKAIASENYIEENEFAYRVIADHIRSCIFLIADGVIPSNEKEGYILRKLIRRIIAKWYLTHRDAPLDYKGIVDVVVKGYPEIESSLGILFDVILTEDTKYYKLLKNAVKKVERSIYDQTKIIEGSCNVGIEKYLPGTVVFMLHDSHGIPLELTQEICSAHGFKIDSSGYFHEVAKQQERGRKNRINKKKND